MARRYRYSFARRKESAKGKLSVGLFVLSMLLFAAAVAVETLTKGTYWYVSGGICLFASLISVYGFIMGLAGFSETNKKHNSNIVGSITNGIMVVVWIGILLIGSR